jgi:hypothetical protein
VLNETSGRGKGDIQGPSGLGLAPVSVCDVEVCVDLAALYADRMTSDERRHGRTRRLIGNMSAAR